MTGRNCEPSSLSLGHGLVKLLLCVYGVMSSNPDCDGWFKIAVYSDISREHRFGLRSCNPERCFRQGSYSGVEREECCTWFKYFKRSFDGGRFDKKYNFTGNVTIRGRNSDWENVDNEDEDNNCYSPEASLLCELGFMNL